MKLDNLEIFVTKNRTPGKGGKYSHRVWQQFWIQKPTSEKSEIFTKNLGPLGPGTLGPGCACAGNRRSPASRRKVRCQGPPTGERAVGRSGGRARHRPDLRLASPAITSIFFLFTKTQHTYPITSTSKRAQRAGVLELDNVTGTYCCLNRSYYGWIGSMD